MYNFYYKITNMGNIVRDMDQDLSEEYIEYYSFEGDVFILSENGTIYIKNIPILPFSKACLKILNQVPMLFDKSKYKHYFREATTNFEFLGSSILISHTEESKLETDYQSLEIPLHILLPLFGDFLRRIDQDIRDAVQNSEIYEDTLEKIGEAFLKIARLERNFVPETIY